jgi:hypothetical protein
LPAALLIGVSVETCRRGGALSPRPADTGITQNFAGPSGPVFIFRPAWMQGAGALFHVRHLSMTRMSHQSATRVQCRTAIIASLDDHAISNAKSINES